MPGLLEVKDVTVHYGGALILENISLRVNEGELVAVVGPNGAGKTTLLRAISGLTKVTNGKIVFDGMEINNLPPHKIVKLGVIHCPERRRIFPDMTVRENLEMGAYSIRDEKEVRERFRKIFESFPILEERQSQAAGTLSGGEQQMLAIGRSLLSNPRILLFDEPSLGLAPLYKKKIFDSIEEIKKDGVTILLVEQDVSQAVKLLDRGYVLEGGRIVLQGDKDELISSKAMREAYLGL